MLPDNNAEVTFIFVLSFEVFKSILISLKTKNGVHLIYFLNAIVFIFSNHKHIAIQREKVVRKYNLRYFLKKGYIIPISTSISWLIRRRKMIFE